MSQSTLYALGLGSPRVSAWPWLSVSPPNRLPPESSRRKDASPRRQILSRRPTPYEGTDYDLTYVGSPEAFSVPQSPTVETYADKIENLDVLKATADDYELHVLYGPDTKKDTDIICDIILVGGPGRSQREIWGSDSALWPRDYLQEDLPKARILSFDCYDPGFVGVPTVTELARKLLKEVSEARPLFARSRPIVWVAHSLGGLLVKAAFVIAQKPENVSYHAGIASCTSGFIFLGTPHHARTTKGWQSILQRIISLNRNTNGQGLVEELTNAGASSMRLLTAFDAELSNRPLPIYSFFETQATVVSLVPQLLVSRSDAQSLGSEVLYHLEGDHKSMCKFSSRSEKGYQMVRRTVAKLIADAVPSFSLKDQADLDRKMGPSALTRSRPRTPTDEDRRAMSVVTGVHPLSIAPLDFHANKSRRVKEILNVPVVGRKHIPASIPGSCEWALKTVTFMDWLKSRKTLVIAGPAGSGKSVLANHIVLHLPNLLNDAVSTQPLDRMDTEQPWIWDSEYERYRTWSASESCWVFQDGSRLPPGLPVRGPAASRLSQQTEDAWIWDPDRRLYRIWSSVEGAWLLQDGSKLAAEPVSLAPARGLSSINNRPYILHHFFTQAHRARADGEILHQFLLQMIEINGALVRHFPNDKLFQGDNWDEHQTPTPVHEDLHQDHGHSPTQVNDLGFTSTENERASLTSTDLLNILISMLGELQSEPVYFIVDGVEECDSSTREVTLRVFELLRHVQNAKICVTFDEKTDVDSLVRQSLGFGKDDILDLVRADGHRLDLSMLKKRQLRHLETALKFPHAEQQLIRDLLLKTGESSSHLFTSLFARIVVRLPDLRTVNQLLSAITASSPSPAARNRSVANETVDEPSTMLDSLYTWIIDYIQSTSDGIALLALFFVAVAERSLVLDELAYLVATTKVLHRRAGRPSEKLQVVYEPWNDHPNALEQSRWPRSLSIPDATGPRRQLPQDDYRPAADDPWVLLQPPLGFPEGEATTKTTIIKQDRPLKISQWFETELFGLLAQVDDHVVLVHPSLRHFLLGREWDTNDNRYDLRTTTPHQAGLLRQRRIYEAVQGKFAASCLELVNIWGLDRSNNSTEPLFAYSLVHWHDHVRNMGDSAGNLQELITSALTHHDTRRMSLKVSARFYLSEKPPSLASTLAALDLIYNLDLLLSVASSQPESTARLAHSTETHQVLHDDLRYAVMNSSYKSLAVLCRHRYQLDLQDAEGRGIGAYAAATGNRNFQQSVDDLLQPSKSSPMPTPSTDMKVAISKALDTNNVEAFEALLKQTDVSGQFVFLSDALRLSVESLRASFAHIALHSISTRQQTNFVDLSESLRLASRLGSRDIVRDLLAHRADPNTKDHDGRSSLHYAAQSGSRELVEDLIRGKARLTAQDARGRGPIHLAAERGHSQVVESLISTADMTDERKRTPLFLACRCVSIPTIQVLVDYGSYINKNDTTNLTPLHEATSTGALQVVKLLLERGANTDGVSSSSTTPLHLAADGGWPDVLHALLAAGAKANLLDENSRSALHRACKSRKPSLDVVKILTESGSDVNARDERGRSPIHYAAVHSNAAIVEYLINAGASLNEDNDGATPLHLAACSRRLAEFRLILSNTRNLSARDAKQRTPFHCAIRYGSVSIVASFISHDRAVLQEVSTDGLSVFHWIFDTRVDFVAKLRRILTNDAALLAGLRRALGERWWPEMKGLPPICELWRLRAGAGGVELFPSIAMRMTPRYRTLIREAAVADSKLYDDRSPSELLLFWRGLTLVRGLNREIGWSTDKIRNYRFYSFVQSLQDKQTART